MVVANVASGVVNGREVLGDKVSGLCVLGGKVEPEKKVDTSGVVGAAVVAAAVGCSGAEVGGALVVAVVVELAGVVVETSMVGSGAGLNE